MFANLTEEEEKKRNKTKCDKRKHVSSAKESTSTEEAKYVEKGPKCVEPVALSPTFPPLPLTKELSETIIWKWCKETKPSSLEESGCAVCGELVPILQLSHLKAIKKMLGILTAAGVTWIKCKSASQRISEFKGPVLDYRCDIIAAKTSEKERYHILLW